MNGTFIWLRLYNSICIGRGLGILEACVDHTVAVGKRRLGRRMVVLCQVRLLLLVLRGSCLLLLLFVKVLLISGSVWPARAMQVKLSTRLLQRVVHLDRPLLQIILVSIRVGQLRVQLMWRLLARVRQILFSRARVDRALVGGVLIDELELLRVMLLAALAL